MSEEKKRGRGRPRQFDENEALDKAIALFWTRGFDATSLDDLSAAMGMARPSLYGAFGDKEAIFMRSLQRYAETVATEPLRALEAADTIREAISTYLRKTAEYTASDAAHTGCMLGTATTVDDPKVRAFVASAVAHGKEQIVRRLQAAVDSGELPPSFPVQRRAQRAVNLMLGLTMRARHGAPLSDLFEEAEDSTEAVLAST